MNVYYTVNSNNRKRVLYFNNYVVREINSKRFHVETKQGKLISHKENWKAATKLAALLQEAYDTGFEHGGY